MHCTFLSDVTGCRENTGVGLSKFHCTDNAHLKVSTRRSVSDMWVMYKPTSYNQWRVSYKRQELLSLREHIHDHGFTPSVWWGLYCSSCYFSVLYFCALFVFVLCLVYLMLPVSLDCPFVIAPSVFFNFYQYMVN